MSYSIDSIEVCTALFEQVLIGTGSIDVSKFRAGVKVEKISFQRTIAHPNRPNSLEVPAIEKTGRKLEFFSLIFQNVLEN